MKSWNDLLKSPLDMKAFNEMIEIRNEQFLISYVSYRVQKEFNDWLNNEEENEKIST